MVVCGPSGSGKSTLIRSLNHLEEYQEGVVSVFDQPLSRDSQSHKVIHQNHGHGVSEF